MSEDNMFSDAVAGCLEWVCSSPSCRTWRCQRKSRVVAMPVLVRRGKTSWLPLDGDLRRAGLDLELIWSP